MAVNEIEIAAAPDDVWAVLAEPDAYARWVVGTKRIRGADEGFPDVGTRLHHTTGVGPLTIRDSTVVLRSERPRVLELEARLGPLGSAHVTLRLEEGGAGTRVVMKERGLRGA
ncbi:MAG TPA: SRPBCC domain-containing protein, partial [Gaiellaceae bacterium]|nr:SRPBCC domain-containing protein [Gaiellaceae bacterium]